MFRLVKLLCDLTENSLATADVVQGTDGGTQRNSEKKS